MANTNEDKKFPLVVWQTTDEYVTAYKAAQARLDVATKSWRAQGGDYIIATDLRLDENGNFEFWLNTRDPSYRAFRSAQDALRYVKIHSTSGWWSLDEIESFINGGGRMIKNGMWNAGFRRHKKNPGKWARRKEYENAPLELEQKVPVFESGSDEATRLLGLLVMDNKSMGTERTFFLEVGTSGMIHIYLSTNPFGGTTAESMPAWAALLRVRGHLTKQQDGFQIDAENIKIGKEKFIHLTCIDTDSSVREYLWPTEIPRDSLFELAESIVKVPVSK